MGERGRVGVGVLAVVLVGAVAVLGARWLLAPGGGGPLRVLFHTEVLRRGLTDWVGGGTMPPPGVDAAETRIHPAVDPPPGADSYAFLQSDDGRPVTYSPCRRISVVVNPRGAPPGAVAVVTDTVRLIGRATGLALTVTGTTREPYRPDRQPYQPHRYGERWAPVLVAWAGPHRIPDFDHGTVGFGGSVALDPVVGDRSYVTGSVVLDREFFADPTHRGYMGEVLLHELGHVVGLDHVGAEDQVMWAGGLHGASLGDGDRAGLARLGRGPCTPDL